MFFSSFRHSCTGCCSGCFQAARFSKGFPRFSRVFQGFPEFSSFPRFSMNLSSEVFRHSGKPWKTLTEVVDFPPIITLLILISWKTWPMMTDDDRWWPVVTPDDPLTQDDPRWPKITQYDPRWPKMIHYGPVWSTLTHLEPLWTTLSHKKEGK